MVNEETVIDGKTNPIDSIISAHDLSIKSKIMRNPDIGQYIVSACLYSRMNKEEKEKQKEIIDNNKGKPDLIFAELVKLNTSILTRLGLWFKEPEEDIAVIFRNKIEELKNKKIMEIVEDIENEYNITIEGNVHVR